MKLITFLAITLICQTLCAEITVTNERIVTGATNVRTIGNHLFVGSDSQFKIESVGLIDLGKIPEKPQVLKVLVTTDRREPVPVEKLTSTQWIVRGAGRVWIDVRVIDLPTSFILDEQLEVELKAAGPIEPPDGELTDVAMGTRKAFREFGLSMAANFEVLAQEVGSKNSRLKTVIDASNASNAMDLNARTLFKKRMAEVMQPKLGSGDLPPHAPQVFLEIAKGFK